MEEVDKILAERKNTHGPYSRTAESSQEMKEVLRRGWHYSVLDATHKEAADMIVHKLARAINGNPFERDHWLDIIGYAQLVLNFMEASDAKRQTNSSTDK